MQVVENKMMHPTHEELGYPLKGVPQYMLAIILYTGGKCNYDLCATQRNGDYEKWKVLDACLDMGIKLLSACEIFNYPVFSGLANVQFKEWRVKEAFFATYLSSSKSEDVAIVFRGKKGILLEFEKGIKYITGFAGGLNSSQPCADVSWISMFPDEQEVLFRRGRALAWTSEVVDENESGQMSRFFLVCAATG